MREMGLRPKDPEDLWGAWGPEDGEDEPEPGEVAGLLREVRRLVAEVKSAQKASVLLSLEEVQEHLGCSKSRLYEHFDKGLPYVMVGRKRQVRPADLEAWLETQVIG